MKNVTTILDKFVRQLLLPYKLKLVFKIFLSKDDWPLDTKISKNERWIIWHREALSLLSCVKIKTHLQEKLIKNSNLNKVSYDERSPFFGFLHCKRK